MPNKIPDLAQNEEMVLESLKKGNHAFVGILLETGSIKIYVILKLKCMKFKWV